MAPPSKFWLYPIRYDRIHYGPFLQTRFYFKTTDDKLKFMTVYTFEESVPGRLQRNMDLVVFNIQDSHMPKGSHREVIGGDRVPAVPLEFRGIEIDRLAGGQGTNPSAQAGVALKRNGSFLVRLNIDLGTKGDGRKFEHLMIPFSGDVPADLVGKVQQGRVFTLSGVEPWSSRLPV